MTHVEHFQEVYFQHDGSPPHYATAVRNYLNEAFGRRVIGRREDIDMPPCLLVIRQWIFCMGYRQRLFILKGLRPLNN